MATLQVKARISTDELLQAAGQLSLSELERFVWRIIALQAQRKAPGLPKDESDLLLKINRGIPAKIQGRYNELIAKRQAETLTADEYEELLRLTAEVEKRDVRRLEYLKELAIIRGKSLTELMEDLNIQAPADG
jgi:hypothetical protein